MNFTCPLLTIWAVCAAPWLFIEHKINLLHEITSATDPRANTSQQITYSTLNTRCLFVFYSNDLLFEDLWRCSCTVMHLSTVICSLNTVNSSNDLFWSLIMFFFFFKFANIDFLLQITKYHSISLKTKGSLKKATGQFTKPFLHSVFYSATILTIRFKLLEQNSNTNTKCFIYNNDLSSVLDLFTICLFIF